VSASLVQSKLGGNASGAFTAGGSQSVSATSNFASNTTAGNLLVLVATNRQTRTSGSGFNPASITVTTSGVTWVNALTAGPGDVGTVRSGSTLYYKSNAPSVSSGSTITVQYATSGLGSANGTLEIEFAIYEFSGVSTSTSTGVPGALIDQEVTSNSHVGGSPTVSMTTTNNDLIITFFKGNSSNAVQPAGYTLGQNMSVVTVGQMAWNGLVASGAQTITWSGAQSNWGNSAIAFRFLPATGFTSADLFGF
jgi:hypothetical protein